MRLAPASVVRTAYGSVVVQQGFRAQWRCDVEDGEVERGEASWVLVVWWSSQVEKSLEKNKNASIAEWTSYFELKNASMTELISILDKNVVIIKQ